MRKTVEAMAAYGIPHDEIASVVGCVKATLEKHFASELRQAQPKANAKVAETLFQQAISGNTTAMIFWLKCRAGWKDRQAHEVTGLDGAPIELLTRIERVIVDGQDAQD